MISKVSPSLDSRFSMAKRITFIGAICNVILGILKLIGGIAFHSHALAADGLHSFADLITDGMVVFASKYGSQIPDDRHPYGHQRIETAATFFLAMLLIITGLAISWDAMHLIFEPNPVKPEGWAFGFALLSILINESLFFYTRAVGMRIKSALLIANAWHRRSDAASSLVVLVGLIGSFWGNSAWDAIAAIIVGLLITHMGMTYAWNSISELVDTAVEPKKITQIETIIQHVNGVIKIHQLRSRMMGDDIFIDVHVQVPPHISVSEGHYIAQQVHYQLIQHIPSIKDVTVHVDPEDDELHPPSLHLPSRADLESSLLNKWKNQFPDLEHWVIHYLEGTLTVDLFSKSPWDHQSQLVSTINQDLIAFHVPVKIRFFYKS